MAMGFQACPKTATTCPWLPLKKIQHDLQSKYPSQVKTIFRHTAIVASALWSINDLRQADPTLNKKILLLCRQKPNLDYLAKIAPFAKNQGYWTVKFRP